MADTRSREGLGVVIKVALRSSKDNPRWPLFSVSGDPWNELSVELQQDLQAWDAMFQKGWTRRTGWTPYSEWEGEVYERVAVRLHKRVQEELDPVRYQLLPLELPPFSGD